MNIRTTLQVVTLEVYMVGKSKKDNMLNISESFGKVGKDTWNKFMNSLNFRTPTKKMWDKFRKVNRNYIPKIIPPLERRGNIITSPDKIADNFTGKYANILRDPHQKIKIKKKTKRGRKKKSYHKNHSQAEN